MALLKKIGMTRLNKSWTIGSFLIFTTLFTIKTYASEIVDRKIESLYGLRNAYTLETLQPIKYLVCDVDFIGSPDLEAFLTKANLSKKDLAIVLKAQVAQEFSLFQNLKVFGRGERYQESLNEHVSQKVYFLTVSVQIERLEFNGEKIYLGIITPNFGRLGSLLDYPYNDAQYPHQISFSGKDDFLEKFSQTSRLLLRDEAQRFRDFLNRPLR